MIAGILAVWAVLRARERRLETVRVSCKTTKGALAIVVEPSWSPRGAERFLQLVDDGFYSGIPFFRCLAGFVCQFGASPPRARSKPYPAIPDDPPDPAHRQFKAGYLSFAGYAAASRAKHVFIALAPVTTLGTEPWETPFGYVTDESMRSTVSRLATEYGDSPPDGKGPDPARIEATGGEEYVKREFPRMDWILSCARTK